jgi:hypothetical protein
MFGGGAKKEKKDEDEDRGDVSGSAKAQKAAAAEENPEVHNATVGLLEHMLIFLCIGRGSRVRRCPLRASHSSH